ncbi:MAG: exodeoxyribonuclease VII large subunit [Eubacterium sp.]|nr:exodeoxyribonuclease VII large subunit [Eubacterium sp.]
MEIRNGKKVYTVSEINDEVSDYLKNNPEFTNVTVKGEISNCTFQQSRGHYYFTIKDSGSILNCVFFKGYAQFLDYKLQNGMQIYASGKLDIYKESGKYQLYVTKVEKRDDKGAIFKAYQELKARLAEEGLFDFEHKLTIPKYPKAIGIVTSQDGAVVHDIIEEAYKRNPYVQFYLYPVQVQGKGSPESVVRGIDYFEKMGVDTIILGRGGGSSEELGAFDTELVARRVYECKIPTIAATGHAIHNTLADYAADERATTPTQAGEKAVSDVMTTIRQIDKSRENMDRFINLKVRNYKTRLLGLKSSIEAKAPAKQLEEKKNIVDRYYMNYTRLIEKKFNSKLNDYNMQLDHLKTFMDKKFESRKRRFDLALARMDGLSPTAKLRGGYGYIETDGQPVTSVSEVKSGDRINILLHDGSIPAIVE